MDDSARTTLPLLTGLGVVGLAAVANAVTGGLSPAVAFGSIIAATGAAGIVRGLSERRRASSWEPAPAAVSEVVEWSAQEKASDLYERRRTQATRTALALETAAFEVPEGFDGVLAFTGRPGSGKSALATMLAANYLRCRSVSFGLYVHEHARLHQQETGRLVKLQDHGARLVSELGPARFTRDVLTYFGVSQHVGPLVIDDVYHRAVFDELVKIFGLDKVVLVGFDPPALELEAHLRATEPDVDVPLIETHPVSADVSSLIADARLRIRAADEGDAFAQLLTGLPEVLRGVGEASASA